MMRRRRLLFASAAVAIALTATAGSLIAIDMYLHSKYQKSAGFNIWGYRGAPAGRKQPGEYRVAVLGGSSAYGYGVEADEAFPAQLEQRLSAAAPAGTRFRVVNLAYNNEGAFSFVFTLQDYDYLQPDLVCLYEGYNDLTTADGYRNTSVFRRDSPVFRLTGYLPIFPIVFREKAASMMAGDANAAYRDAGKTVFRPTFATRTAAGVLRTTGAIGESLERQLDRATAGPPRTAATGGDSGCRPPWEHYCTSIARAVEYALSRGRQVMVVTQPYELVTTTVGMRHMEQQREAAAMLEQRYGREPRVAYVNLGDAVDLGDPSLSFDHMHLTAAGNARIAERLVKPILELSARRH